MQQPMPNPEDISDPTTIRNMALVLIAKAFKLNYSTPTNNNLRISLNPRNRQIAQPGNQNRYNAAQNVRNQNANQNGNGNAVAAQAEGNVNGNNVRPRRRDAAYLQTQLLIAQKEEAGLQLQAKEYDLMATAGDIDKIKEVNANYILMANLQQGSTLGIQIGKAPIYDSDGSSKVLHSQNCYDNDIFNMCTQEEKYTEAKSREEVYFSNTSKMASVSKSFSIPNEESSDDTSSVARKFLNEVKDTLMTLQQAAKFVRDFTSLAKEADDSLDKIKALEFENELLLKAVVNKLESCIIKKENEYATLWNNWYKKCEECKYDKLSYDKAYNDMQNQIERLQAQLGDLKGKSSNTQGASNTIDHFNTQPKSNTKNNRVPSASTSSCLKNKEVDVEEHHRDLMLSKNKKHMSSECNNIKLAIRNDKSKVVCAMCKKCLITANHDVCVLTYVNDMNSHGKKQKANVLNVANQKKHQPTIKKPKKLGSKERLASPKPSKPRTFLRWSPTRIIFDLKGKIIASNKSECQYDIFVGRPNLFMEPSALEMIMLLQFWVMAIFNLEVAFRRNTCYVRNLEGVDLLKGNRTTNLYTINLYEMASASLICLIARAISTKSWLRHQRLSHLNFDTINDLAKNDIVIDLPKFKYHKEHLYPSCEQGKSKKASHPPKHVPNSKQRLHCIHMDLGGPIRVESINRKRYILVIMDDYSCYTWVHFLRSKDEAQDVIKTFLKKITILLQAPVIIAEAISTACYTQNRSIIHRRFNKTPYELINGRKPDISFLHVFEALCYPKNDREDLGKLGAKGDIEFFIGYSANSSMAFEQRSSKPGLQGMTSEQISSGLDLTYDP
ncbi:retrovirus-related pol polyprotein from transposon TNT 1-94 [Tanacetum coccineum]